MKYFTDQILQKHTHSEWMALIGRYRKEKEKLRPFLSKRAQAFFYKVNPHDALILSCEIGNVVASRKRFRNYVQIRMRPYGKKFIYSLRYNNIKTYEIKFDSELEVESHDYEPARIIKCDDRTLGYWLFDEISRIESGDFRHEIVLSGNGKILIEFDNFTYSKER